MGTERKARRRAPERATRVRRKDAPWGEWKRAEWTDELKARFIHVLAETGMVVRAAEAVQVDKSSPYKLRARDPEFAADWALAKEIAYDELTGVLRQRVIEGVPRPLHYHGKIFARPREYSDRLAGLLLRHHNPMNQRPFVAETAPGPRRERQVSEQMRAHAIALLRAEAAAEAEDE